MNRRRWFGAAMVVVGGFAIAIAIARPSGDSLPDTSTAVAEIEPTTSTSATPRTTDPLTSSLEETRRLPSSERVLDDDCANPITVVPPANDLAELVSSAEVGTCFFLSAGEYSFSDVVPKDYMTFLGAGRDEVIARGSDSMENAFHGTALGVTIGRMSFVGFRGDGGEKPQEQGPIRGTSALWKSDAGALAEQWLIEDIRSEGNLASGIFLGDHFTVRGSLFVGNGVTGLSGDEFVGGLVEGNVVTGNGAEMATGFLVNGGGMKFGQAGSPEAPLVVRGNEVHNNAGIGIWCDIACDGFEVIGNYVHDQSSRAVMVELSRNAVIRDNIMINTNTWSDFSRDFNAGAVTVGESANVLVEDNYIDGAVAGVVVRQTQRPVRPQEDFLDNYAGVVFLTEQVVVRSNVFKNIEANGISIGATGIGLIPDANSIVFEANSYDDPEGVDFWWAGGDRQNYEQWQKAGRDLNPRLPQPDRPSFDPLASGFSVESPIDQATDASAEPVTVPLRINAGGPLYVGPDGEEFLADIFHDGGDTALHAAPDVFATEADDLYRTERWGAASYRIPIANGTYVVVLHHAEMFEGCQVEGCRSFSTVVEGVNVATDLDLFAETGGYRAVTFEVTVEVDDSTLDISLVAGLQNPQISAIEVLAPR